MVVKLVRLYEFFLAEKVVNKTMLDLHVANALFSCDEQGNQGWEESHCSKNSKGLVKNYGLASLPLVRIKPSL